MLRYVEFNCCDRLARALNVIHPNKSTVKISSWVVRYVFDQRLVFYNLGQELNCAPFGLSSVFLDMYFWP